MIRAGMAVACAVLISFTVPADACGWKRDGYGWRSAGYAYSDGDRYRDGWGYRRHRDVSIGIGFRDRGWRHRRQWRGDGNAYGWRADRVERRGFFRDRRMDADVVTK